MVGIASAAIYSVLEPIAEDTGLTLGTLNAGTSYMVRDSTVISKATLRDNSSFSLGWAAWSGSLSPCNTERNLYIFCRS